MTVVGKAILVREIKTPYLYTVLVVADGDIDGYVGTFSTESGARGAGKERILQLQKEHPKVTWEMDIWVSELDKPY